MPKRSRKDENSDEYFRRKIRKLEKKLKRRHRSPVISSESSLNSDLSPQLQEQEDEDDQLLIDVAHPDIIEAEGDIVLNPSLTAEEPEPGPSGGPASEQPASEPPALDDEILSLLGETPSKEKKYGADIQTDLAVRWEHICTSGLTRDAKKELLDKHIVPNNCKKIEAPSLNPEVKAALTDTLMKKDKALEMKQKQQAAAISCLSEALTLILASEHKDPKIIKLLIEGGRLMCDSQYVESLTRRSFICSTLKKELKDQLQGTEIDNFLFGEKLADTLKAAKAINRSASDMKASTSKPSAFQKKSAAKNSKFARPQSTVAHAAAAQAHSPAPPAPRAPQHWPRPARPAPPPPPPQPRSSRPRAPAPPRR